MDAHLHPDLSRITERIRARSHPTRSAYLARMQAAKSQGVARAHLTCANQAHAFAAAGDDQPALAAADAPNLGIVTAYNDMLSAHRPYETYPDQIRTAARKIGATAQVAGGVPAMCDGVTQGQTGMELSLFSRDVIAMAAGIALSHNVFDAAVFLGVCDKIVPGLVIAAATFGHLPAVFLPAGPMESGLPNDEKARIRRAYAEGKATREELLAAEMAAYHGIGTCTFYGTANSNQMLMEFMGLHLPGASFAPPTGALREALTAHGAHTAIRMAQTPDAPRTCDILDERAFVNGIIGLLATGGSTNLLIHLIAMAKSAGVILDWEDFAELSDITPLLARVYPNGLADVNHFHAAGGLAFVIEALLDAGLLHPDTETVFGKGLRHYTQEPVLNDGVLTWRPRDKSGENDKILRRADAPFSPRGGLMRLTGNIGTGVMKISAVAPELHKITAPAAVFESQDAVKRAFSNGDLDRDVVVVVRHQGPRANGMPELHNLTPPLSALLARGHRVALITDGRMSGASGKVPAAIHVAPEAAVGGPIARIRDGDMITVDAENGIISVADETLADRPLPAHTAQSHNGNGRELFDLMRAAVGPATSGASIWSDT